MAGEWLANWIGSRPRVGGLVKKFREKWKSTFVAENCGRRLNNLKFVSLQIEEDRYLCTTFFCRHPIYQFTNFTNKVDKIM
jgi:hypothetical protein